MNFHISVCRTALT